MHLSTLALHATQSQTGQPKLPTTRRKRMTVAELEQSLAEIDSVVADLDAAIPRLTLTANYGERMSSGSKEAPTPVNIDAVSAKHALHVWLVKTCLMVGEPFTSRGGSPRTVQSLSSHLLTHLGILEANGWVPKLVTELKPLLRDCTQAAHTAAKRIFAGTCQTEHCGTELWTITGTDTTRCRTCGAEYHAISEWRTKAKAYAQDRENDILGYPQALAQRLATIHGETIGADYIRVLAARGALKRANPERGADGKKLRALYRLGDIKQLIQGSVTA